MEGTHRRTLLGFVGNLAWLDGSLSLVLGLFRDHIRVYEVANTGWWYDLGFYAAVISGFGGLSLVRKKEK